jgi:hypothetical protein
VKAAESAPSFSPGQTFLAQIFRDYEARGKFMRASSTLPFTALVNHARSNWSELTHSANAVTRPKAKVTCSTPRLGRGWVNSQLPFNCAAVYASKQSRSCKGKPF